MLVYILKSAACLAILFVFYKLFLEKESIHKFKRFYLLGALVFSVLVPTLVFTEYVVVAPPSEVTYAVTQPVPSSEDVINVPQALEADVLDIEPILWGVYFLGLFFFGLKFIRNLFQIFRRIRRNPKFKLNRFTQVLLQEKITPHTFFSYIFLNKTKFESKQIPQEVLLHEETHAQQKHSWDVVFVELLQVIFWVNPFIYLSKKAIKLNHEFLADQAVLEKNIDETTYKNTLLSYLSPDSEEKYQPLANAINYSSIKKRFTIMKTHTSKKAVLFRSLLLLPLLTILLYSFSDSKIETISTEHHAEEKVETLEEKASVEMVREYNKMAKSHNLFADYGLRPRESEIRRLKHIYGLMSIEQKSDAVIFPDYPLPQKGANKEDLKKYNFLATKYNKQPQEKRKIPLSDLRILEMVYRKMNASQRENSQPFPECLPKNVQDGVSRKLMAEYDKLARHYNEMPRNKMKILKKDVNRLEYIYNQMSEKQKADAEPYPDFPEPPPPPKVPELPKDEKEDKIEVPPSSQSSKLSDLEYADKVIRETIANQDPYDHGNQLYSKISIDENGKFSTSLVPPIDASSKKGEKSNIPPPSLNYLKRESDTPKPAQDHQDRSTFYIANENNIGAISVPKPHKSPYLNTIEAENSIQQMREEVDSNIPLSTNIKSQHEFPAPPNAAYRVDQKPLSNKLKVLIDKFTKQRNLYQNAVKDYLNNGKGKKAEIHSLYATLLKAYNEYKVMANDEGVFAQPVPALSPIVSKGEVSDIPPPPPPVNAPKVLKGEVNDIPPPPAPPEPQSPLDHVIEMAKKGATFYYEGKEVNSDEAIELLKNNESLNIDSRGHKTKHPEVRISKKPYYH